MKEEESKALRLSVELWNQLIQMHNAEVFNEDMINDYRFHIHAIQALIMARPEIRKIPTT